MNASRCVMRRKRHMQQQEATFRVPGLAARSKDATRGFLRAVKAGRTQEKTRLSKLKSLLFLFQHVLNLPCLNLLAEAVLVQRLCWSGSICWKAFRQLGNHCPWDCRLDRLAVTFSRFSTQLTSAVSSNKKLVVTSASLLVTSALLVVTRS